jgi:hypothetical protein
MWAHFLPKNSGRGSDISLFCLAAVNSGLPAVGSRMLPAASRPARTAYAPRPGSSEQPCGGRGGGRNYGAGERSTGAVPGVATGTPSRPRCAFALAVRPAREPRRRRSRSSDGAPAEGGKRWARLVRTVDSRSTCALPTHPGPSPLNRPTCRCVQIHREKRSAKAPLTPCWRAGFAALVRLA